MNVSAVFAVARRVMVTVAPGNNRPGDQFTVLQFVEQAPCVAFAEFKVSPVGKMFVTTTNAAGSGP